MSYLTDNSAALVGRSAPLLAAAAKRAWTLVTAPVRSYVQREAVYRELSELDDRMLADIGLNRSDVYAVANGLRHADSGSRGKRTA
jgi:uncharacterized protein YjiS (DUF1127 family)